MCRKLYHVCLLLTVAVVTRCSAAVTCGMSGENWTIDLSPLTVPSGGHDYLTSMELQPNQCYEFNVCGVSMCGIPGCYRNNGTICQFGGGLPWNFLSMVAKWDPNNPPTWTTIDPSGSPNKGIQATFNNGDYCAPVGKNRVGVIQFTCSDQEMETPTGREMSTCVYVIQAPTKYACVSKF